VPYEDPLFRLLAAGGFNPVREKKKLLQPLKNDRSRPWAWRRRQPVFKNLQLNNPFRRCIARIFYRYCNWPTLPFHRRLCAFGWAGDLRAAKDRL